MQPDSQAFDLLCAIARPRPDLERARAILETGVEFDALFSCASYHAVRPRLSPLLTLEVAPAFTQALGEALGRFEQEHVARALAMLAELVRVIDLFREAGIPVFTFKGPALAQQLYGGLARREYVDIDLLVPPDRAEAAKAALASLGYRNAQGDPAFVRTFLGAQRQVSLARPGLPSAFDLHWAFTGRELPFPLAPDEVWSRLDTVGIGGRLVPTLVPEDLALLLAGHGTKEAWHRLTWVCDFAWLVVRHPELDWTRLLARARRQHCGGALLLAVAVAHRLLGTTIPAALAGPLADSPQVDATAGEVIAALRRGAAEGPSGHLYDLLLCDRTVDRWWTMARTALTPTAGDYHAMPLPRPLWPLYWLTRPFRLAGRALRRG